MKKEYREFFAQVKKPAQSKISTAQFSKLATQPNNHPELFMNTSMKSLQGSSLLDFLKVNRNSISHSPNNPHEVFQCNSIQCFLNIE